MEYTEDLLRLGREEVEEDLLLLLLGEEELEEEEDEELEEEEEEEEEELEQEVLVDAKEATSLRLSSEEQTERDDIGKIFL